MKKYFLQNEIRNYLKKERSSINYINSTENESILFTDSRMGFYNKNYIKRLVIFLKGSGCSNVREHGGCTFCGFYNATNSGEKISDFQYKSQIDKFLSSEEITNYSIICIYNDGSLLDEKEIGLDVLLYFLKNIEKLENIKKVTIESRIENIDSIKLSKIRTIFSKDLEIAVGFESANSTIRDLCINKSFKNTIFESKVKISKEYDIEIIPLLMIKPPFLTEKEAIRDIIKSLIYLEQFKFQRIDIELPTIEENTLTYKLWEIGEYKVLNLWAVIYLLKLHKKLRLKTYLYISPMIYSVESKEKTSSCDKCNTIILKKIEEYNKTSNIEIFNNFNCDCKEKWSYSFKKRSFDNLEERIERILEKIKMEEFIGNNLD